MDGEHKILFTRWGKYYQTDPIDPKLQERIDTWIRFGKTYKCGNCGRIPFFIDIMDRNICYHCQHVMKYVEAEDGRLIPIKYRYSREDEAPMPKWEAY